MLSLELIYEKMLNEDRSMFYSWMDDLGNIHKVSQDETHTEFADFLLRKEPVNIRSRLIDRLFVKHWLRITHYGDSVYAHNNFYPPNSKQLSELKNLAIEHNMKNIIWDNEDVDKIMWDNQDW